MPASASLPKLLLTCGDPAGIGPEVVVAAWATTPAHARAALRVVADPRLLAEVIAVGGHLPRLPIATVVPDDPRPSSADLLLVVPPSSGGGPLPDPMPPRGVSTAAGGAAAARAVETAVALVLDGTAQGIVTGPLHKAALHAAGYDVPGHTELLARGCGLPDSAASMMLWLPSTTAAVAGEPFVPSGLNGPGGPAGPAGPAGLGVVHATLHESLRSAVGRLSGDGIVQAGLRLAGVLEKLLCRRPRIAVAALNPHGGESGLFGDEETRVIAPAVARLVREGVDATGPLPADTLFLRASRGEFDGVVAQYHDQGHIPIKLLGMHRAVNITLGLPLVRTSVAHGTAFDIVGTSAADPTSMLAAIDAALRLVEAGGAHARPPLTAAAARSA